MRRHLDVVRLQLPFVHGGVGERRLEDVVVESTVGHGAVEAADGSDAGGEGFGLQGTPDVAVAVLLQWLGGGRAETFGFGFIESPPLLPPGSLSVLHDCSGDCTKMTGGTILEL